MAAFQAQEIPRFHQIPIVLTGKANSAHRMVQSAFLQAPSDALTHGPNRPESLHFQGFYD
jgi:hypothetical protein